MKKLLFFVLTLCLSSILNSCAGNRSGESTTDEIKTISLPDAIGKEKIVNLSEVAQSIRYIPLETSDSSLLGSIPRPILERGVFYVTITSGFTSIYKMYSIDGKYLGQLGRPGRAAGEYHSNVDMSSFSISVGHKSGNPMIFSTDKIIEYDKNGKFIKEVRSPIDPTYNLMLSKIKPLGDNYLSIYTDFIDKNSFILFFNANGEMIGETPESLDAKQGDGKNATESSDGAEKPVPLSNMRMVMNPYLYDYKDNIRLITGSVDSIFSFNTKMEKSALYHIDYGKYKVPLNASWEERAQSIFLIAGFTCEWESHLYLTYNFGKNEPNGYKLPHVRGLYNKNSGELTLLKRPDSELPGFNNDLDNGAPFWPVHISREGEMIMSLSALKFIELSEKYNSPEMKRVAATLTEESNPVIVIAKIK
jgi:hypothetical protein